MLKVVKTRSALMAEWLRLMPHNDSIPGLSLARDLCCRSFPSLSLPVSYWPLCHILSYTDDGKRAQNKSLRKKNVKMCGCVCVCVSVFVCVCIGECTCVFFVLAHTEVLASCLQMLYQWMSQELSYRLMSSVTSSLWSHHGETKATAPTHTHTHTYTHTHAHTSSVWIAVV